MLTVTELPDLNLTRHHILPVCFFFLCVILHSFHVYYCKHNYVTSLLQSPSLLNIVAAGYFLMRPAVAAEASEFKEWESVLQFSLQII